MRWIDIFGLRDWEIHIKHKDVETGNNAYCFRNSDSRAAELSLCKTWPEGSMLELTDGAIRLAAFEEVCHVLLYGVVSCAYARFVMEHEISEAEHALVRVLQSVLFPRY